MATLNDLVDGFRPVTPESMIAVGTVLPLLASTAVALRFFIKHRRKAELGLDDWSILVALLLCIGLGAMMIAGSAVHALGQPTPFGEGPMGFLHVINDAIITTEKIKYAFNIMQALAFGTIKLSVLLFYRRIFRGRSFNITSWIMIGVTICWTLGFLFTYIFECRTKFWAFWSTLDDLLTHCLNDVFFQKVLAITDVVTDVLILSIPIPCIWKLQLNTERKLGICGIFLLGSLVVAFGIVRLVFFEQRLTNGFSSSQGILLMSTWMYWSMIEMGMAIVAACLPSLRPLFGGMGSVRSFSKAIRSLFSVRSLSSEPSMPGNQKSARILSVVDNNSNSSEAEFVVPTKVPLGGAGETFAMRDLESQEHIQPGQITVKKNVFQSYSK
ncbi:plasma membrane protein Pth11-like protein [Glarea lozoyensis ATCC 20868]|uniref:Plasma membrane protein Pth11-like protein n=1 Tax=Glarea lozoyensis (strain ATCC 20868 / MF5171) TaxID=1116229 RepID=S3D2H0_GLAL2|nr:plasma membrane protein Pth11-like protein [Glarea lozoyensis ATCC 20868]EPE32025.1 plasma membrane protein Pth11-like protein [Glarea lozoyensis ATCC 20868]